MPDPIASIVNQSRSPAALAKAVTAPRSILLAGGAAAAAVLSGIGLPAGLVIGAGAWIASTFFAVRRARSSKAVAAQERIDPFAVREPWRQYVQSIMATQSRFDRAVQNTRSGPLRDRLAEIGARVGDAVRESWELAKQGDGLDRAVEGFDDNQIRREHAALEAEMSRADPGRQATLGKAADSVAARLASVERMATRAQEIRDRAVVLDAQLDETVAKATELSVTASSVNQLDPLGTEVDSLVDEMESLRRALEDTNASAGPATATA